MAAASNLNFRAFPLLAACLLFCLALAGRVGLLAVHGFDGLYGQDAYAYYGYARELFTAVTHFQSPPPFWWPLGYPALLNLAFFVGGVNLASAQSITVLCGALVAPFAFALAHEAAPQAYKKVAGWVAGLICAVGGQLAQSSVVIMADAPALLFATVGAWLLLRYARTRTVLTLGLAAFAVGMAVWTRWQNLIFAGVWVLALVSVESNSTAEQSREKTRQARQKWTAIFFAIGIMSVVLLPQLLIRSATAAPLAGQSWLEGWSVGNFFSKSFDNVDGHFEYALPVAIFYGQVVAHPAYLFAMLTPLFGIGVVLLVKPINSLRRAETILLLGWIFGTYLFLAGIPYENFRFSLGLFAPLAVVTGIGAGWVWNRWRAARLRFALWGWIGIALVVMTLWQPRVLAPILESKAREISQARWLQENLVQDATLWTMGVNGTLETYSNLRVKNLWNQSANELRDSAPAYLFIDTQNFESQWRGRQPHRLYRDLRDGNALQELGQFQGWTLFRIVP